MLCLLSLISKYVSLVAYLTLLVALVLATFLSSGPKSNGAEMSSAQGAQLSGALGCLYSGMRTRDCLQKEISAASLCSAKYARLKL